MWISTRTYDNKYTYLWRQVHVLFSIGQFCGLRLLCLYRLIDKRSIDLDLRQQKLCCPYRLPVRCWQASYLRQQKLCCPYRHNSKFKVMKLNLRQQKLCCPYRLPLQRNPMDYLRQQKLCCPYRLWIILLYSFSIYDSRNYVALIDFRKCRQ